MTYDPTLKISQDLSISFKQVASVLGLLQEGNTIPFIARYRKEATGSLDEVQIRDIKEKCDYIKELEDRRSTILASIESQGKMTDELRGKITTCETKNVLEDLYLPYKPKRRTKATIAKEKGLEPLALRVLEQPLAGNPLKEAEAFINQKGVLEVKEALEGAQHIVAEWVSENSDIRAFIREAFMNQAVLLSKVKDEFKGKETKFEQYYEFSEPIKKIPSHRYLAIRRGEQEQVLSLTLEIEAEPILDETQRMMKLNPRSPFSEQLKSAVADSYKRLLYPSIESDLRIDLKMQSDRDAVDIFAKNLRNILLSAPLGGKDVIGIDPGLRTGCKCAAASCTGKFLDNMTFYLTKGSDQLSEEKRKFISFIKKFNPKAIAIGNGTASRETEVFVKESLKESGLQNIVVVQVSESGASVYSASDVAREEFPDLDLTIRGAISIARRLQDPLAELVKVEPKALGVGQYQHDVYQPLLEKKLHEVVESCVNLVGVDLNTASPSLLSYVVGVGPSLSKKIVAFRDQKGAFESRQQLLEVPGLGPRSFEQSAGFLRLQDGANPLDASAVHPERYGLVTRMAKDMNLSLGDLIGNSKYVDSIKIENYQSETVGKATLEDIIAELKKPGRDPRSTFETAKFRDDVTKIEDLKKGMFLEGIVTNVTAFGAFVDIGVHQDGLVHISQLSDQFVRDPNEVVKTGDKIKVEVTDVNIGLKRISLSAKIGAKPSHEKKGIPQGRQPMRNQPKFSNNPFSNL
jgi:uncharacterized protein